MNGSNQLANILVLSVMVLGMSAPLTIRYPPADRDFWVSKFEVRPSSPSDVAAFYDAIGAFDALPGSLPALLAVFHEGRGPCDGHLGLFRVTVDHLEIHLCDDRPSVLIHELAHAWVHANVNSRVKEDFLKLRGLEVWATRDAPWAKRGTEQAAFIIQQILFVGPGPEGSPEWSERRIAFELLTGVCACASEASPIIANDPPSSRLASIGRRSLRRS